MRNISTLIGEVNEQVEALLDELIVENRTFNVLAKAKKPSSMLDQIRIHKPHLVFLSVEMQDENMDAMELCRQIVGEFPSTIVIITSQYERASDLRESMKAGARDFVSVADFDARLVSSAMELVSSVRKFEFVSNDKHGKAVAFVSPKGGVGRSTLILNTAAELAQSLNVNGERNRVLVVDYDLEFGDIAYLGNIKSSRTISDLNDIPSIDTDALEGHLVEHDKYGFWVLTAPKDPMYAGIITKETLDQTLILAKRLFDYVLIDTAQGLDSPTLSAVDNSDLTVVVSGGTMMDMKNLKIMLSTLEKLIEEQFPRDKITILLNQYSKTSVPSKEVVSRFKFNVLGVVPKNDNVVTQANNYNKSVVRENANTDVGKAMKEVAQQLVKTLHPLDGRRSSTEASSEKKGFMGKLFGK